MLFLSETRIRCIFFRNPAFEVELEDSYYNMKEIIEEHMHLVENAKKAMTELGIEPEVIPVPFRYPFPRLFYNPFYVLAHISYTPAHHVIIIYEICIWWRMQKRP